MNRPGRVWLALGCLAVAIVGCERSEPTATDVRNAAESVAPLRLYVEPYLQNPTPTSMTVVWWTEESAPESRVDYGAEELRLSVGATDDYVEALGKYRHLTTLEGLEPGAKYDYRALSGAMQSDRYTFDVPSPDEGEYLFNFLGDGRTDDDPMIARHRRVMSKAEDADLIVALGDTVFEGSTEHWFRYFRRILTQADPLDPGSSAGSRTASVHVVGNHEIALSPPGVENPTAEQAYDLPFESIVRFKELFVHPPNGSMDPRWEERYFSVRYGPMTLIALDANNTSGDDWDNHNYLKDGSTPDWEPGSEQHSWLEVALEKAARESAFTVVVAHPSPYSSGSHGNPDKVVSAQRGYELRGLEPLFREHGVDAVITSHDHLAERSFLGPVDGSSAEGAGDPRGLNFFVMGNSGSSSRPSKEGWESWMKVGGVQLPTWIYDWADCKELASFLQMRVSRGGDGTWTARLSVVRTDSEVFDEVILTREDPRPR